MKGFKFSETFFSKRIVVQEEENLGDWVFYDTIKKIGDYDCKLAVKNFRGRKYHVWYTNDIQTLYGPWKFYGLSGLILHAYDESKEFEIQAKSIKFIERDKESIYTDLINNSVIFFNSNKSITINELKKHIEDNNEIIGTATLHFQHKIIRNGGVAALIEDVAVREKYRGHGIGVKLIEHLIEIAKSCGCYKINLSCFPERVAFYERCGLKQESITMRYYL
jgi:GNAT superfamily N-acetyltransferase